VLAKTLIVKLRREEEVLQTSHMGYMSEVKGPKDALVRSKDKSLHQFLHAVPDGVSTVLKYNSG